MLLGKKGEEIAASYLESKGYTILERNFKCRSGEIDLIACAEDKLVFIEVKTRRNLNYGLPREAVNKEKVRHIFSVIDFYTRKYNIQDVDKQIDVVEILLNSGKYYMNHIENAVY